MLIFQSLPDFPVTVGNENLQSVLKREQDYEHVVPCRVAVEPRNLVYFLAWLLYGLKSLPLSRYPPRIEYILYTE